MAEFQIAWNPTTYVATAQAMGATPPAGSTVISDESHSVPDDSQGEYGKSHVLYHHVRDALYHEGVYDMQRVTIAAEVIFAQDMTVTPDTVTVAPAGTQQLTVALVPPEAVGAAVVYATSNPAAATVSPAGLVTGVANGNAEITVTSTVWGFVKKIPVTVATPVASISSTPATVSLAPAATQQITTAFTPATASNQGLTYATSDPLIATVSTSGLITAVAAGSATITVTSVDGAKTDTVVVTVA